MNISVPQRFQPILAMLADFDEERWSKLISFFKTLKPTLSLESTTNCSILSNELNISIQQAQRVLGVVVSLYLLHYQSDKDRDIFLDDLVETVFSFPETQELSKEKETLFRNSFKDIMLCEETLGVSAKAVSLHYDEERIFSSTKILTDIRPIFLSNSENVPPTVLIKHSLKLKYLGNNGEEEIFIALDDEDLEQLEKIVIRARQKGQTLRKLLKDRSIPLLGEDNG